MDLYVDNTLKKASLFFLCTSLILLGFNLINFHIRVFYGFEYQNLAYVSLSALGGVLASFNLKCTPNQALLGISSSFIISVYALIVFLINLFLNEFRFINGIIFCLLFISISSGAINFLYLLNTKKRKWRSRFIYFLACCALIFVINIVLAFIVGSTYNGLFLLIAVYALIACYIGGPIVVLWFLIEDVILKRPYHG